ncbi:MAG: RsmB/NOP family class I SAM-dependent RNA methyltransferase [archaeon]
MLEPIPGTENIEIKEAFRQRYEKITDWDEFIKHCLSFPRRAIRVNTLKITVSALKRRLEGWTLTQIPWCKEGFWVEHKDGRRDIGNTIEHALGYIYVQESVSMIPPLVLGPRPGDKILDMCAAPGSKSTQIAQYMGNQGLLISNDYKGDRLKSLGINLARCGVSNVITTLMAGQSFRGMEFDRILIDAPCSGTGTIRKSLKTFRIWNPGMVRRLASTQKKLLETGYSLLKKGGTLVYSTCSLEPEEDEGVVDHLLKSKGAVLEPIRIRMKRSPVVSEFEGIRYTGIDNCLRIWPQDNNTNGFFVAKIRK